ncbi:MAG: STAS domain-containing protein [Clostridiales bacterium]|nr:STAS domain-containing protein [Clostridiales bacterium]
MQEVTVAERGEVLFVKLSGEIDSRNADDFFEEVMSAYRTAPTDITFECSSLEFIDSTTLGTFVKILKRVKSEGHTVRLISLQPRLKKLFVICALDTIMEIS